MKPEVCLRNSERSKTSTDIYHCIVFHLILLPSSVAGLTLSIEFILSDPTMPFEVRPGDELAKMLGESALLADLGPLLRMKQAMCQVNRRRSVGHEICPGECCPGSCRKTKCETLGCKDGWNARHESHQTDSTGKIVDVRNLVWCFFGLPPVLTAFPSPLDRVC